MVDWGQGKEKKKTSINLILQPLKKHRPVATETCLQYSAGVKLLIL